ncbi:thymidylate synthase [Streptosporangium sp. NBC_01495]|uniref:thymidylate synthase n=1 Tax=Streptosporangium sp. NBC_01495 TaxID=2903899 RepID=UPI002E35525F|nr:thymidylate synthase [Streptosporangium sp. NBC_01495]
MLGIATFPTFHEAYIAVLDATTNRPDHTIATRGNTSAELLNVSYRITDPRDRLPFLTRRPVNIAYNLAEALWYLSGRCDLDMIGYYAPGMANYSADGHTLTGTAYGRALFARGQDGHTQWDRILDLLRSDPDSKRAVLGFFRPAELEIEANPDVSCTVAAQFLLRENRLHLTSYMRGNDAYMGMVSDVFAFTFLQEFAAALLSVQVGHYTHHVGSMHVNEPDYKTVRRLLVEVQQDSYQRPRFAPPTMPAASSWGEVRVVLEQEEALRTNTVQHTPGSIEKTGLPPYWQQILLIFEAHRQIKHTDQPVAPDLLDALDPGYRWLVTRRWRNRTTASTP